MADKDNARSELRRIRDALSAEARAVKSQAACQGVLAELKGATCVAIYSAIRSELNPNVLAAALRQRNVAVAYPRVLPSRKVLEFCLVDTPNQLRRGTKGILEPREDLAAISLADIDCFVIPALGFDEHCNRLGWGQGHYDHTLALCPRATRVGICFQEQIVASLPVETTDEQMDLVVTDSKRYQGAPRTASAPAREEA